MKKERYNIFNKSHKGLRCLVLEAWAKTNKCDFMSASEVNDCIVTLLKSIRYYIYHIRRGNMIIHSAINPVAPYSYPAGEVQCKRNRSGIIYRV